MTMHSDTTATFLLVVIGGQRVALNTAMIREILDPLPETRVPSARPFAATVVNVRGTVVPLITINKMLNLEVGPRTAKTRFVLLSVPGPRNQPLNVALLADAVLTVTSIPLDRIEPLARISHNWPAELLTGLYRDGDVFVIVPDMELILSRNLAKRSEA